MDWKDWIGKTVFLRTKQNKVYSGLVIDVEDVDGLWFIGLRDKFGLFVTIAHTQIIELKEERSDEQRII
jgi:hypothetical protein